MDVTSVLREEKVQWQMPNAQEFPEQEIQGSSPNCLYIPDRDTVDFSGRGTGWSLSSESGLLNINSHFKGIFWAKFLFLWNIQQNKTLPAYRLHFIIIPLKDPRKFTETYLGNLKKIQSFGILCPASFMGCEWQLKWLWKYRLLKLGIKPIPSSISMLISPNI